MPTNGQYTDEDVVKTPAPKGQYTADDVVDPYSEAGAAANPPVDKPKLPLGLAPRQGLMEKVITPAENYAKNYFPNAAKEVGTGAEEIVGRAPGQTESEIQRGLHHVVSGVGQLAAPLIPEAAIEAPLATGLAAGAGMASQWVGKKVTKALGGSDDTANLVGDVTGMGAGYGAAKLPGLVKGAMTPEVAPGMSDEATGNMQDVQARRGTEKMFKAAAPSANDQDFRERLSESAPDIAQLAKEKPLTSKGGIINPDFRPREFVQNLSDYMDNLWKQEYKPQIDRTASAQAPLDAVKTAMEESISQVDKEKQPGLVNSLQEEVNRMPRTETIGQMEARRVQLSDKLNRYYRANPAEQVAMENQNFNVAATKAEYNAVLDTLDKSLKANGEAGGVGPRGRYGNLSEVRGYIAKQMNPTEQATAMQHIAQILFRRGPERLITGAMANPSAGRQVGQGLKLLGKSGLEAPVTPGPRGPNPEGLRLPETASNSGLSPEERGPQGRPGPTVSGAPPLITPPPHPYNEAGLPREQIPAPPNQGGITRREPGDQPIHIEGKPTTTVKDTQASADDALRVLRDPNASATDKVKARARLHYMPAAQEKPGPTPTPSKWGRFGRQNIGRPVVR